MMHPKPTILFVEDEPDLIDIYHSAFDGRGWRFFSTDDIDEALLIARTERPQAVLLDIVLPDRSQNVVDLSAKRGFDFLERVQQDAATRGIPVVVFTNLTSAEDRRRAMELGATDYLVKADHLPREVLDRVASVIASHKEPAAL
jgi:DNA-binding response OmpR family regulator